MGRYDKYQAAVKEELEFQKEQERLHDKHKTIEEDAIIIETSNMGKFLLNYLRNICRAAFGVVMISLSAAGLLTLLDPGSRAAFRLVLQGIAENIKQLI